MLLTRSGIVAAIHAGEITITPFNQEQLNPNSYDLRLAPYVVQYTDEILNAAVPLNSVQTVIPKEGICLQPGELYLMATEEFTATDKYVPGIEGRSSIGRLGVSVHATAGFGDVGFAGTWTLEVSVVKPVILYAGMRICQIFFEDCSPIQPGDLYTGKYLDQTLPRVSGINSECHEWL